MAQLCEVLSVVWGCTSVLVTPGGVHLQLLRRANVLAAAYGYMCQFYRILF